MASHATALLAAHHAATLTTAAPARSASPHSSSSTSSDGAAAAAGAPLHNPELVHRLRELRAAADGAGSSLIGRETALATAASAASAKAQRGVHEAKAALGQVRSLGCAGRICSSGGSLPPPHPPPTYAGTRHSGVADAPR